MWAMNTTTGMRGTNMKTKTQTQHTPTPWKLKTDDHLDGTSIYSNEIYITSLEGDDNPHQQKLGFRPVEEQKANAAFIVRAVNSHEALLDALKTARERFVREGMTTANIDEAIKQAEAQS